MNQNDYFLKVQEPKCTKIKYTQVKKIPGPKQYVNLKLFEGIYS